MRKLRALDTYYHTHRLTGSPEWNSFYQMRKRCLSPTNQFYADYGGRGITICERWQTFEQFYADMGPRPSLGHSLDRINNEGNYEPSNCRWATRIEQSRNKRNNVRIEINGETLTISEWAEKVGIAMRTLWKRIDDGWSPQDAIFRPVTGVKRAQRTFEKNGICLPVSEWAKRQGINRRTVAERIRRGWDIEKAIFDPLEPGHG